MSYPTPSTISDLNLKNLETSIKWTPYLGQLLSLISFIPTPNASGKFLFNRADALLSLSPSSRGNTLPKHVVDTTLVTEPFERFADICVLDVGETLMANQVNLFMQQLASVAVRILREFNNMFFNGNGTSPNLKGLNLRADTTIIVGGPLTLNVIYQLKNSVTPASREGLGFGGNVLCSHSRLFRKFLELLAGKAVKVEWVKHPKLNIQVCSVFGMLWIIDDNIPVGPASGTILYALNLDAIQVLYACCEHYPTNEWGLFYVPIPTSNTITEFGGFLMALFSIRNLVNSVARATRIAV